MLYSVKFIVVGLYGRCMSAKATLADGDEQHKSEYVETKDGWATVWTEQVEGTDVWITEHVVDAPLGATAPHTVRCTWRVHKVGQNRWIVSCASEKQLFNGCANGRSTPSYDAHKNKLESELNHHYLEGNSTSSERLSIEFDC